MRGKRWFVLLLSLALVLLTSNIGITSSSLLDVESSTGNTFQAWASRQWLQTTKTDFDAGVLNNVDTSSSSGDVTLAQVGWGSYSSELLINPGAETGDTVGWTAVGTHTANFVAGTECQNCPSGGAPAGPRTGTYSFMWDTPTASDDWAYQEIDLYASGFEEKVSAGEAQLKAGGYLVCGECNPNWDRIQLRILLYDSGHSLIETSYDSGQLFQICSWTWYGITDYDIPTNARYVRVEFQTIEPPSWGAGKADDFTVKVRVKEQPFWHDISWSRRAPVTINNPGSALTDYQVRVDVTYDADMQPDFDDIRFVDADGSTELSHWRESYIASTSAIFWVKVPSIPSGNKTIYMYYGNDAAGSASDGDATFEFFDDFPGTSLDASKWQSAGTITVAGSEVHIYCNANGQGIGVVIPDYLFGLGYSVEYRERFGETDVVHLIQGAYQLYDAQHHGTAFSALADGTGRARTANDSIITETILGLYDTSYHRYQITRISGEAKYYYDGILLATHTTNVPPDDLRVQFTGNNTADIYLEWVFVRQYADPEPTASTGSEEGMYIFPGTIDSQVLDTGINGARWDALFWDETLPAGTNITFEVRASDSLSGGFPDASWVPVGDSSPITSGLPSGRYMQWRAILTTSDPSQTPILHEVRVYHY